MLREPRIKTFLCLKKKSSFKLDEDSRIREGQRGTSEKEEPLLKHMVYLTAQRTVHRLEHGSRWAVLQRNPVVCIGDGETLEHTDNMMLKR